MNELFFFWLGGATFAGGIVAIVPQIMADVPEEQRTETMIRMIVFWPVSLIQLALGGRWRT